MAMVPEFQYESKERVKKTNTVKAATMKSMESRRRSVEKDEKRKNGYLSSNAKVKNAC